MNIFFENCEFCNSLIEFEKELLFGKLDNNIVGCNCCGAIYYSVYNEVNDFVYLEFSGSNRFIIPYTTVSNINNMKDSLFLYLSQK